MRTFVTAPKAEGNWPGIVFYTDIFQLTDASLRWAVRLAGYGFLVAVPEIYHRVEPPDTVLGVRRRGQGARPGRRRGDHHGRVRRGHRRGVDVARRAGRAGRRERALHGRAPRRSGPRSTRAWPAPRCWYPTGLHNGKLGKDESDALARAGEIERELLLIFGTRDPHTPPPGRATVKAALDAAGTRYQWHEYDAEHAFGRDIGPRFDPEATDRAFAETVAFFRRVLR